MIAAMRFPRVLLFLVATALATTACQHPGGPVVSPGQNAKPLPVSPGCPSSCAPDRPLRNHSGP